MTIEVLVNFSEASLQINCLENCSPSPNEGRIINLHPSFPIPEDQLHVDGAFPWMQNVQDLAERQMNLMAQRGIPIPNPSADFYATLRTTSEQWASLKKAWSLSRSGNEDLAKAQLQGAGLPAYNQQDSINQAKFNFFRALCSPCKQSIFDNAKEMITTLASQRRAEFEVFLRYFAAHLAEPNDARYFEIFSDYFAAQAEFEQTLTNVKYEIPLQEHIAATSMSFRNTRMFYGDCFETLTSNFTVLAMLNNLAAGRNFDEFLTMDLRRYLSLDKSARANPFRDNESLYPFAQDLDTTLRNASHHRAMRIDGRALVYRSGGTGAERRMPYVKYLYECNRIALQCASLLQVELLLIAMTE